MVLWINDTTVVSLCLGESDVNTQKARDINPFGLRAPQEVLDWVKRKGLEQDRSMNWVINQVLAEAKAKDEQAVAA